MVSDLLRIRKYIAVDPSGCWLWTGHVLSNGYGQTWLNGKKALAHRAFYQLVRGDIPNGFQIDHLCRNRRCVNISHLEVVTYLINNRRQRHFNGEKTACVHGHPFSAENTRTLTRRGGERVCRSCEKRREHKRQRERIWGKL